MQSFSRGAPLPLIRNKSAKGKEQKDNPIISEDRQKLIQAQLEIDVLRKNSRRLKDDFQLKLAEELKKTEQAKQELNKLIRKSEENKREYETELAEERAQTTAVSRQKAEFNMKLVEAEQLYAIQYKELTATKQELKKQEQANLELDQKCKTLETELSRYFKMPTLTDVPSPTQAALSREQYKQLNLKYGLSEVSKVELSPEFDLVLHLPTKDNLIIGVTDDKVVCFLISKPESAEEKSERADHAPQDEQKGFKKISIWEMSIAVEKLEIHPNGHIILIDKNKRIHILQPGSSSIDYSDFDLGYADDFSFEENYLIFWQKVEESERTYFLNLWELKEKTEPEFKKKIRKELPFSSLKTVQKNVILGSRIDQQFLGCYKPLDLFTDKCKEKPKLFIPFREEFVMCAGNNFFVKKDPSFSTKGCLVNARTQDQFEFPFNMDTTRISCAIAFNDQFSFLFAIKNRHSEEVRLYFYSLLTQVSYPVHIIKGEIDSIDHLQNGMQVSLCVKKDVNTKCFYTYDCKHLKELAKKLAPVSGEHVKHDPSILVADYHAFDIATDSDRGVNPYSFTAELEQNSRARVADTRAAETHFPELKRTREIKG